MFSNKFFKHVTNIALIISSLSLFACGGGEANDTPITIAPALDPITINALNAKLLAKQGYSALTQLSGKTSTLIQTAPSTASLSVVDIASASINNFKLAQADGIPQNCTIAGTRTSSDLTVSPVIITFDACDDGTTTIAGQLTITALAVVIVPNFNGTIEFTDLQITDNANDVTVTLSGAATVIIATPSDGISTFTFKGTLLSAKSGLDTVSFENFTITRETNLNTNEITESIDYSFSSSLIDGSLTVATIFPFKTTIGMLYPYQGQLVVIGAQGSKVRLTVNSGTGLATDTFTLEVDPDGNGYDPILTQVFAWSSL